jgi:hypothetical protein
MELYTTAKNDTNARIIGAHFTLAPMVLHPPASDSQSVTRACLCEMRLDSLGHLH